MRLWKGHEPRFTVELIGESQCRLVRLPFDIWRFTQGGTILRHSIVLCNKTLSVGH